MSSVGPNEAACFGPRTKLSKACNSPPDQNRLPETVLGPFQDRTKLAVTAHTCTITYMMYMYIHIKLHPLALLVIQVEELSCSFLCGDVDALFFSAFIFSNTANPSASCACVCLYPLPCVVGKGSMQLNC